MAPVLVLGTTNAGKVRELLDLLTPFGIGCESLAELPGAVDVEETGATFAENAVLKATAQARALGRWVLAEDSGLVVPALRGEPGVHSARYAGGPPGEPRAATDARNSGLLLERLAGQTGPVRAAHYLCHAVLADPDGRIVAVAEATCGGMIAERPAGSGGFGYDPLFIVPEYHRTFGELPAAVKAVISHRARALRALLPAIVASLGAGSPFAAAGRAGARSPESLRPCRPCGLGPLPGPAADRRAD
jgi:XTP/dITP diphosphohydrolase